MVVLKGLDGARSFRQPRLCTRAGAATPAGEGRHVGHRLVRFVHSKEESCCLG